MPTTAYIVGSLSNVYFFDKLGKIAVDVVGGNVDKVIPTFITMALPEWFVYIFLLSLLAAAMSTISSQLHTQGTAFGVDIYGTLRNKEITPNYSYKTWYSYSYYFSFSIGIFSSGKYCCSWNKSVL